MAILHRYDCGCKGIPMGEDEKGNKKALIVWPCDRDQGDYDEYSLFVRDMEKKTSEAIDDAAELDIFHDISNLISDGYRMRDLARTIDIINKRK